MPSQKSLLEECVVAEKTMMMDLDKEQFDEVVIGVRGLPYLLFQLGEGTAQVADKLKDEHTANFSEKIPAIEKLTAYHPVKKPPEVF